MHELNNILYVSSLCSENIEAKLLENDPKSVGIQIQKYHRLLAKGLEQNSVNVCTLSYHKGTDKVGVKNGSQQQEDGITYQYIVSTGEGKNSYFHVLKESYFYAKNFFKSHPDAIMICDVLNFSVSLGATLAARIMHRHVLGIITDFPDQLSGKKNFHSWVIWRLINLCTGYIVLTEQMNEFINKKKTVIVSEGHVDNKMVAMDNSLKEKVEPKVCIYAGMLHRKYGIEQLIKAFIKANVVNTVLHIYGDGDYAEELSSINCDNIVYFGIVPNGRVVEAEKHATLLINPRPTTEEYTKYSFPSKNMEYMVSGTPLLTTKLPGMPKEYEDYVYVFDDETVDGMAKKIRQVLELPVLELYCVGTKAKQYVLTNKNNVVQAKKIINSMRGKI